MTVAAIMDWFVVYVVIMDLIIVMGQLEMAVVIQVPKVLGYLKIGT